MGNGRLLTDQLTESDSALQGSHPMDSSRILLGLMTLSQRAEAAQLNGSSADTLDGVISKGVLRSLMGALHFRDVSTVRHSRQVAMLAVGMAQSLGWESRHLKILEVAALLHDIGKIGVPDNILFKPSQLSPDETDLMALHHRIALDVLQACRVDKEVLEIVSQSHSHYNGATDDFRRIGSEVHQGARILAVADAYDSLSTDQVYREGKPHDEIMKILRQSAGTQFDGNIISALSRWLESEGRNYINRGSELVFGGRPPGPADPEEALEATSLGHIFSYLYLLESLYDGFYLVDSQLNFVVWNVGMEGLLKHSPVHMLNQTWSTHLLPHTDQFGEAPLTTQQCPLHQVITTGRAATTMIQVQSADQKWVQLEVQSVPLVDHHGHLHGAAEIFREVGDNSKSPQSYRDLKLAATRDPLTSIANRGQLETQLLMMLSEYNQRTDPEPFAVMFLDVDFFKKINDTHGHSIGDQVLIDVARLLQHETYSGELVGRYGGEEFIVICPDTNLEAAMRRAERLRNALRKTEVGGVAGLKVTASFGVTEIEPGDSVDSILRRADDALYEAKETGRNRTRSLTNQQIEDAKQKEDAIRKAEQEDPFLIDTQFRAFLASDMIVYKLGGFVEDTQAKLVEVTPKRALIHVGKAGMLGFWGSTDEKRPVQMEISFGDKENEGGKSRGEQQKVNVKIRIRPLGRCRDPEAFQHRANQLMRVLRSYFAV